MSKVMRVWFLLLLCSLIIAAPPLRALWIDDGVPLCTAPGDQTYPYITSDGASGAIVTWPDYRNGNYDIYAQRIDVSGTALWTADGVPLCTATGDQEYCHITSDGAGGAIVTWPDYRSGNYDIYAQRIDASGTVQWTADGIPLCTATGDQENCHITSDGAGGAIISWQDTRNGNYDIYAQRVNASGTVQWTADGVPLCTASMTQRDPRIISDGAGGAIVTWDDFRTLVYCDIYAQRVNASGTVQWTADGVLLCAAAGQQYNPQVTSDGTGGAIVTWEDNRSGSYDIYAQLIDASGSVQWTADGAPLCTATGDQHYPQIISDGSGGAIMTWQDSRNSNYDIYAQRVNASGTVQWTADGVPLCTQTGMQYYPMLTADGSGGAITTWRDSRNSNNHIYTQRINAAGTVQWTTDGVPLSMAAGFQLYPQITSDGAGGAIITWQDERSGNWDIYAHQIDSQGNTDDLLPDIYSVNDVPGDEGGYVNLTWEASPVDYYLGEITEYTVWRALEASAAATWLSNGGTIVSSPAAALETSPTGTERPILRHASLNGEMFFWELIASQAGYRLEGYAKIVPTAFDSTAVCDDYHYFQIIAHTSDPSIYHVSDPDSGYSVDNLSPCPPLAFAGEQIYTPEGLALTWEPGSEPDLGCYRVYRGTDQSFVPGTGNLLIELENAEHFDDTWTWDAGYYYKLSAVDMHGNESGFALLAPGVVTGNDPVESPTATYLTQNYPNPFNPQTTIAFGIKENGHVSLRIYDAAGRLVATLVDEALPAGHYSESWNGLAHDGNRASSGVYFCRLSTKTFTENRKMILLR